MHRVMVELHQSHVHLARLLDLLDEQVSLVSSSWRPGFFLDD